MTRWFTIQFYLHYGTRYRERDFGWESCNLYFDNKQMSVARIIAFYLPQFHPTEDNNVWWGEGFTEWTNVGKAKPLFKGHYQPKIPADLGYYDLRLAEIREQQARLARSAGVEGFCYYHYWFGNGKMELERPFNEVLTSGNPDFPFCLCWANETWHSKFWKEDGSIIKQTLVEQLYPGDDDVINHFKYVLRAFKDNRYIKIDGRPVFVIYRPLFYPECRRFISMWNNLTKQEGIDGIYFIAYSLFADTEYNDLKALGFDAVCSCRLGERRPKNYILRRCFNLRSELFHRPRVYDYKKIYKSFVTDFESRDDVFPTMIPNWDHTPRSGVGGYLYKNATPSLFEEHAKEVIEVVHKKDDDHRVCFLKSWNEWGEGNYMEPDLKYGKGYIEALRRAMELV